MAKYWITVTGTFIERPSGIERVRQATVLVDRKFIDLAAAEVAGILAREYEPHAWKFLAIERVAGEREWHVMREWSFGNG
jgi:hypothetical protein